MANIWTAPGTDIDLRNPSLGFLQDDPYTIEKSSTRFAYLVDQSPPIPDIYTFELLGTGFTYNASGNPVSGTINRINNFDNGTLKGFIDGISISLQTLVAIGQTATETDDRAFFTALFAGNDVIRGADRNDIIVGYTGSDTMYGGAGNDMFYVDNAGDIVHEAAGQGRDTVATSVSYGLRAGEYVEVLRTTSLYAVKNMNLSGNNLAQSITGNNGDNVIVGKGGNDVLTGWGGNDTFRFNAALGADNIDRITDFHIGDNEIQLENAIFTALTATGSLAPSLFKDIAVAAKDANDRIIYNSATGVVYYDADGSGTAFGNVKFAVLDGKPMLSADDFFVI